MVSDGVSPIPGATVKLFDSTGAPYKHTITDSAGAFSMTDVPEGTYSLAAVADGYRLSDAVGITLNAGTSLQANLSCTADATLSLGAIAGVLTVDNGQGVLEPLSGGKITLKNSSGDTLASTYTVADGEFAFYDLADGVYTLLASAEGYQSVSDMTTVIAGGSIANITMSMVVDSRTYNGTVSGVIRDSAGQVVAGCFVGLYQTTAIGTAVQEHLVAVTKTNTAGKYLFGGVTDGSYLVKAKLEQ